MHSDVKNTARSSLFFFPPMFYSKKLRSVPIIKPKMPNLLKGEPILPKRQKQTYEEFFESTAKNELLNQKTTVMIQLAASFVILRLHSI